VPPPVAEEIWKKAEMLVTESNAIVVAVQKIKWSSQSLAVHHTLLKLTIYVMVAACNSSL